MATIPVDVNGAFVHTKNAVGPGGAPRTVTFRGRSGDPHARDGHDTDPGGGCDHTDRWTMRKL